jgi:peptidoglycan hydrolase-like protein with peptidoglycan-binding domain
MSEQETPTHAPPDAPAPGEPPAPAPAAEQDPTAPASVPEESPEELEKRGSVTSRIAVGRPTLTSGSADPAVAELTAKLNALGFDCPVTTIVTPEVLSAVNAFRRALDVDDGEENIPNGYSPDVRAHWIGPETWAALLQA